MSTVFDKIFAGQRGVTRKLLRQFGVPFTLLQLTAPPSIALGGNAEIVSQGIRASASPSAFHWPGGDFVAAGAVVGGWVNVQGFAEPSINGLAKVAAVDAETLTVAKTLQNYPAGDRVGIAVLATFTTYGSPGKLSQLHLAGGVVKATDQMVILDPSDLPVLPQNEGWSLCKGSDASAEQLRSIVEVFTTMSGDQVAAIEVATRA